jgi:hypothetical protein
VEKGFLRPSNKIIYILFGLLLVYSVIRSFVAASTATLWYDEILTWAVTAQGGWHRIVGALFRGIDGQPPFFHWLERYASHMAARPEIGLRLPCIIAFPCTLLSVFLCAKRRAGPGVALLCSAFLLATPVFQVYTAQARPYGLVVACIAFALLCYQRISSSCWAIAMAAAVILAESFHHFAVFSLLPFAAAELVYTFLQRIIRWRVWGALACSLLPILLSWRIASSFKSIYGLHFWARYSLSAIPQTYGVFFSNSAVIGSAFAFICAALIVRARFRPVYPSSARESSSSAQPASAQLSSDPVEGALLLALLLLPLTTFAATKLLHGAMLDRYVLSTVLAMALGLSGIRSIPSWIAVVIYATCGFFFCVNETQFWRSENPHLLDAPAAQLESFVTAGGHADIPVVVSDPLLFLPVAFYGSPPFKPRFIYLIDEQRALQYTATNSLDKNLSVLHNYVSFPMADFSDFARAHEVFLLYAKKDTPRFDWLSRYLPSIASLQTLNEDPNRALYLVTMNQTHPQ